MTDRPLPMTRSEMQKRGWDELDVLLISGDAYIDHPSFGAAVIGRTIEAMGYRVGIVAQPDWQSEQSLMAMGRPRLACAVTAGNLDSMVNLYTVGRRFRKQDAYTPGGVPGKRPPHAVTVYSQLARKAFPGIFLLIGGIEASLRRIAHYDYWQDKIRPSALVDSKADILVYGMGERAVREILSRLENDQDMVGIPGTARFLGKKESDNLDLTDNAIELPDFNEMKQSKEALMTSTLAIEREMNPHCGQRLCQKYQDRWLVVEPPAAPLSQEELDTVYAYPFTGMPHPSYQEPIPAFDTVKCSISAVRGCPGGCAFCGLVAHQGRWVRSRSEESIVAEVERLKERSHFRGTISDIGGAAGNILGHGAVDPTLCQSCRRASCLYPKRCKNYRIDEDVLLSLLRRVRRIQGVKHLHINSGIRLDLALEQPNLSRELIHHHVSGHLKVAPEHLHPQVLKLMRKNKAEDFYTFMRIFAEESAKAGKEQYLIPLFISNYPGCGEDEMQVVDDFLNQENWSPQQVQDYIPLPMTMGAAMYYTGKSAEGHPINVNRGLRERRPQIGVLKRKRRRGDRPQPQSGSRKQQHKGRGNNSRRKPGPKNRPKR